ncbi:hypothetical protein BpHYR1_052485 [Brachionus plicatilis]|uniref:Uncharacterized protein n=1 Tax=Brachionus plicatilis TaxID=10195 RepID=A0A3M7RQJ5_BRAPC|nr:hypothetical protein BpHYR1_052485 [Brachionus plicatilis]
MGNLDSLKSYIQMKQIETKNLLCNLRSLEKQVFYLKEKIENEVSEYNAKFGHLQTPQGPFYVIQELKLENKNLEKQYKECKKFLSELSDELNVLISCYKEMMEMMVEKRAFNLAQTPMFVQYVMDNEKQSNSPWLLLPSGNKFSDLIDLDQLAQKSILNSEIPKRYEIWFKNTKWKLNDDLGQSGLAKFLMKNFLYTKVMNQQELDCVEHNLEIESCKLQDLDPGQTKNKVGKVYEDVLSSLFDYSQAESSCNFSDSNLNNSSSTSGSASMSNSVSSSVSSLSFYENSLNTVQNSTMVRIYCKERPPVGIPVIEHLELNVSPLKINLTNRFFKTMIKYFFENEINSPNNGARTQISEETGD